MDRVHCRVILGSNVSFFTGATLRVRVLDVSRAGAVAFGAGETILTNLNYHPGGEPVISVEVICAETNSSAHYTVAAHLDLDADGQVSHGDWITTESYPVLTHGYPQHCQLQLQKV